MRKPKVLRISALACAFLCMSAMSAVATAAPATATPRMGAAVADSDSGSDLAARKAAVEKALAIAADTYEGASAQVQAAAAKYTRAVAELPGAQDDLANASGSVVAASVNVDQANIAVTDARAAAATARTVVAQDDQQVHAAKAAIASVVTSVYQGSAFLGLDSLLTDGSPGEVLDRFGYANEVVAAQRRTLAHYVTARLIAAQALNRSVAAAAAATRAAVAATAALAKSQQAKSIAAAAQQAVTTLIAARQAALAVALKNKAAVLAQYKALQKENKQVETQLAAQAAADKAAAARRAKKKKKGSGGSKTSPPPSTSSGGQHSFDIMPIHGWMSSPFGMRFDPIYKRWQLHAGVDIAAPTGTRIHAARAGRVIRAGWDGGYGNYTCIDTGLYQGPGVDHGKDIANCYAHQSRIEVHVGEHVRLGQEIGLVGETGAATGPHLHFEVRIDGRPVQPLNWLPKCFC